MKGSVSYWQAAGFIFTSILGTFLHFLFDLTGENVLAALFSAVNESIWEHKKLLFYPMLLFALVEYRFWGKNQGRFWCVKLLGILLGLLLIPVLYYTYTGISGISADWLNITIFFLSAGVTFYRETKYFSCHCHCPVGEKLSLGLLLLIAVLFTVFTFFPPHIPFFQDPISETYGFFKTA